MTSSIFNPSRMRTEKCSNWDEIVTTILSHCFKNLLLLAIFCQNFFKNRENALLEKILKRFKNLCLLCYYITLSHKLTKTMSKSDFLPIKNWNYYFYKFDKVGIRISIEILCWIQIQIKRMRIRNTAYLNVR